MLDNIGIKSSFKINVTKKTCRTRPEIQPELNEKLETPEITNRQIQTEHIKKSSQR